jgi:cytochrome c biogenesis protein CcmG/thiol:disulfide interchange protein DsbE
MISDSVSENTPDTAMRSGGLGSALKHVSVGFVGLVVVALIALLLYGVFRSGSGEDVLAVRKRPAPEFTLSLFGGGETSLADFAGQVVVINFWASWCDPCKAEAPILEEGWQTYRDRGVTLIGVNTDDTEASARAFIDDYGLTYANGPEPGSLSVEYGVLGLPETFFIDRDGMIAGHWKGEISREQFASFVEGLLQ